MKKIVIGIVVALVVAVIVLVVVVGLSLDTVIKKGVETVGPELTKVDVKVEVVRLSIFSGSGSLKGLVLGNPEGYKTPQAISVGSTSISLVPSSVFSDKIVVRSIRVDAPQISFELGPGGNNLQRIQANLGRNDGTKDGRSEPPTRATDQAAGKKLQVDEVVISGGKITLGVAAMGGTVTEVPLPEIRLSALGTGPDGITAASLGDRVLTAIMNGAISVSKDALAKAGQDAINNATKSATDALGKGSGAALDKATKGLGDLLKPKKE